MDRTLAHAQAKAVDGLAEADIEIREAILLCCLAKIRPAALSLCLCGYMRYDTDGESPMKKQA
jgi:hypothetical protein